MQPPQQNSRIDLVGLKSHIVKKIGAERSKKYFNCLQRFLNLKLTKAELDKSCFRFLGRENLPLHNQLIRSILKNSWQAKAPPPLIEGTKNPSLNESGPLHIPLQNQSIPTWSNGVLPPSPRKSRTSWRDRKLKDKPSPLGSLTKFESHQPNGELQKPDGFRSLVAPLGIPFCSASVGGARKSLPSSSAGNYITSYESGSLPDSENLRKRMEEIAASQELEGVSMESANMVNNFVDVYLKRLIKSCVDLVGTRQPQIRKQQVQGGKLVNAVQVTQSFSISMRDFQVAMELNPMQLGEDWSILVEKVNMHTNEQ